MKHFCCHGREALGVLLEPQRRSQRFVLYQLELDEQKAIPFAFKDMEAVKKAGYEQPACGSISHGLDGRSLLSYRPKRYRDIAAPVFRTQRGITGGLQRTANVSF